MFSCISTIILIIGLIVSFRFILSASPQRVVLCCVVEFNVGYVIFYFLVTGGACVAYRDSIA